MLEVYVGMTRIMDFYLSFPTCFINIMNEVYEVYVIGKGYRKKPTYVQYVRR